MGPTRPKGDHHDGVKSSRGPTEMRDHGNPMRPGNIWIRPLGGATTVKLVFRFANPSWSPLSRRVLFWYRGFPCPWRDIGIVPGRVSDILP